MGINDHELNEFDVHDPEDCDACLERDHSVTNECRCGNCCEHLILEASIRDGEREPRIAAECQTMRDIGPEIVGYLLNDPEKDRACHFFDRESRLCMIYETRPLMCRLFDCDRERQSETLGDVLSFDV